MGLLETETQRYRVRCGGVRNQEEYVTVSHRDPKLMALGSAEQPRSKLRGEDRAEFAMRKLLYMVV